VVLNSVLTVSRPGWHEGGGRAAHGGGQGEGLPPQNEKNKKPAVGRVSFKWVLGSAGLEPATSCMSSTAGAFPPGAGTYLNVPLKICDSIV